MKAIILTKAGDPKVLKVAKINSPRKFKKDDVLIRHTAIGVNFFDIGFRRGQYKLKKYPAIIGTEACGVVEAVGSNVTEFRVGERVAYCTGPIGAYQERRIINKKYLVIVPNNISDEVVAGSLLKGSMAQTLLFRVYQAKRAKRILVHGASGGVGQFLCQWARAIGVEVIGVVGSQEKVNPALANGCRYVVNRSVGNFAEEIYKLTKGEGVGVVYDSIGKEVFEKSLKCLYSMGLYVSFGEASGKPKNLDLNQLVTNALYLTRPTLALYKANRSELALSAAELFDMIQQGLIKPKIKTYDFEDVALAHREIESRKSIGSIVLKL